MKNQNTKRLKRITALVLCVVLLLTSIPIAFAANGEYNPAPYFSDDAQQKGAAAWLDEEGDLQVRFPAATGRPTHADWKKNNANVKAIDSYVIELSDLGGKLEKHTANPTALLIKEMQVSSLAVLAEENLFSVTFTANELGDLLDLENNRYNIAITAVDSEGWRSMQIHALVSDIPNFQFDMSKFNFFTEDSHAMREMIRFESVGKYTGYQQTGDTVSQLGRMSYTGAIDPTVSQTVASTGYRVRLNSDPAGTGVTQTIDTPESRQTWNFAGAEEVWYWLDLSDVELRGLSFRLRANYKRIDYNLRNASSSTEQKYGNVVYSTLGTKFNNYAAGEEPYLFVQNENGNWEKVMMNNGTVDLGHFKGYVRIPIEFFCSETATEVGTNSSVVFGVTKGSSNPNDFYNNEVCLSYPNGDSYTTGVFTSYAQIDPAGTPISNALLIQQGRMYYRRSTGIGGDLYSYEMGSFLAPGIDDGDITKTTANNPRRAYVEKNAEGNWTVQNRENGYKALEDIYSAGISYTGLGEGSANNSIFLDNIMFYRTDGEQWNEATIDGYTSTGSPVASYYNQKTETQSRIFDAIDKYVAEPSWSDYRGVAYVESMIAAYFEAYSASQGEEYATQFLSDDALSARAAEIGRATTWQNYITARKLCSDSGMLDGENSRPNDLVPILVQSLEQLPDPSQVTSISETLRNEIIRLYQAYVRLNYGQLKMLGSYHTEDAGGNVTASYEEEKLLRYFELLEGRLTGDDTNTGYKMANYPFIIYNDFEKNTEIGDKVWRIEDDINYNTSDYMSDYSHIKNISSFTTNQYNNDSSGERSRSLNHIYTDIHNYAHAADSTIEYNGFNGTKGYSTTIDSAAVQIASNKTEGTFYLTRFNKDSVNTATSFEEFKLNNMSAVNLGGLAMSKSNNDKALEGDTYLPLCLAMYVDFSEMTDESGAGDFYLSFKIHTLDSNGNLISYFPGMGSQASSKPWWRTYYVMNQETGEWERVYFDHNGMTSGVRFFPSKSTRNNSEGNPISLAGYKGYIAIPMVHFKRDGSGAFDIENQYLIDNSTALNNIVSVEIGFTAANGKAASFANKSYVIDNIGFTYDPDFYSSLGVDISSRTDNSYAEIFGAKSTKATEFETAVEAIDPYDTATLATKIEAAKNLYGYPYLSETTSGTLSQWQKDNVQTVKQAKALLDKYIAGDIPTAAMSVDALKTEIAKLPSGIPENAVTSKPLPNPGFIVNASDPLVAGTVNYTDFGFVSRTQAEDIAKLYTDTYKRLSATEKASLTDTERTTLLNAYNAAMRCTGTLETIRDKASAFSDHLKTIYTRYTEGTQTLNLISVSKRNEVAALSATEYEPLPYYAKLGLSDGSLIPAFANMTDGISRFFANTVMNSETGEIEAGGVKVLMDKYTALYAEVKTQLDAKQVLTDDLVSRLNETIAEYNDLIPAYKNIFELYYGSVQADASGQYQGIKDIIELFDRYDVAFADGTKEATLALNPDNESTASQTLNVNYIEELPVETGGASNTYFKIKYNGTLTGGVDTRSYVLMLNGNDVQAVDLAADPIRITEAMLGDTLKNNTYSPANPFKMVFTARLTGTEEFAQQLSDVVTIYQYRPADPEKGETGEQRIGEYTLNVTYTPKESYVVTIPAEFPIDWGNTNEVDVSYKVDCVLGTGKKIEVDVTGSGKLTAEANSAYTMDYTAEGFGSKSVFTGVHTGSKPATAPTVQISQNMWDNRPVGKYKDTLTYTVEYTTP